MQKWEQKNRNKVHELKVQNAKSSVRKYSGSRQKVVPSSGRSRSNQGSRPLPNNTSAPVSKILQIFQLQQYGPLLSTYGFPQKLGDKMQANYIDEMIGQVKQKDRQKFISLVNTLAVMSKDVKKQSKTPKSTKKPSKVHYPPTPSMSANGKQIPNSAKKSQKNTVKFRVKQKNPLNSLVANKNSIMSKLPKEFASKKTQKTRQNSVETDKKPKKTMSYRAVDDLSLIHDFTLANNQQQGYLRPINESNRIIQRLTQKLATIDPTSVHQFKSNKDDLNLNLQMQKIKQMYLSFDSATITSNIINIDLHEMIECLAMQVKHLITQAQVNMLAKSNADKIKSLLHQSFSLLKAQSKQSRNLQQNQCLPEKYLKNSLQNLVQSQQKQQKNTSIHKFNQMRDIDVYDDQNRNIPIQNEYDTDQSQSQSQSQSQKNDIQSKSKNDSSNCSIDLNRNMKQSSLWGNSYIASVINDFSCFDSLNDNNNNNNNNNKSVSFIKETTLKPKQQQIKSFIQLVVMAGRMEKQVPIIAYIYLKRLLNVSMVKQAKITAKNWKNLLLVTLIQASKIWDDQSLQNHSFAKLIKPYTTLQINRLQKYLVYFLDYRLTIDQKQYSEAYFKLRKHVGEKQSIKSVNIMRLDLRTIQKLQNSAMYGQNKKSTFDKKEYFKKLLNKSF